MIVADASAIAELLLRRPAAAKVDAALSGHSELHVPEHFHIEVMSALRRYALRGELGPYEDQLALADLIDLRVLRYPVAEMCDAIWELRDRLTVYDAAYLTLARRLDVGLITLDRGLAEAAAADGRLVDL